MMDVSKRKTNILKFVEALLSWPQAGSDSTVVHTEKFMFVNNYAI